MHIRFISSSAVALLAFGTLLVGGGLAQAAPAVPGPTNSNTTTPVGVNVVNGIVTTPLDPRGLTSPVGYSSVPANFGPERPITRSVIGADTRKQITNTEDAPYRAVVKLGGGTLSGCTGWMVSADTLVTAGHCVYNGAFYTSDFNAWPARNGDSMPFGACQAKQIWTDQRWITGRDENYDWAVVKLNCTVGQQTGWFGYKDDANSNLVNTKVTVTGYPGDKPQSTMWSDSNQVSRVNTTKVWYPVDTIGGQSGAPVYTAERQAVAIHAYGTGETGASAANSGTRIKAELFNTITRLKDR